jgi:uncharacterized protein
MGGDWKDMFLGVETNDFDLVGYYIANGIYLNYQHPEYLTSALIESINRNHLDMMIFLLENGALPNLKEVFSNKSPMTIAKELKNKQAVEILNKYLNTNETIEEKKISSWFNIISKKKELFKNLFSN